jgi:tetratricopeptide (TPR) repeat protein
MKTLLVGTLSLSIAAVIALVWTSHRQTPKNVPSMVSTEAASSSELAQNLAAPPGTSAGLMPPTRPTQAEAASNAPLSPPTPPQASPASSSLQLHQALQTLLSSQASFGEKQTTWQQLKDSGKLDQAITELEQRAASNPHSAEYPAALGQAYLQKAGMLKDLREQGILGMKADQTFDAALALDASNWDAGFWKALAMSYWPPQLNKGQEVIERFAELIKLQETQPAQPQYAQTYVVLGEQYQKQGFADYARQIWQRGNELFPSDAKLLDKLTQPQPSQTAAR